MPDKPSAEQPPVRVETDQDLSPETREMLKNTPEDGVLIGHSEDASDEKPQNPGLGVGLPVPSLPDQDKKD